MDISVGICQLYLLLCQAWEGLQILQELPQFRIGRQTVGLILILLNLGNYFRHFPSFREVDQIRIVEEVWVSLLQEKYVCLIFSKEGDTGRVDRSQFFQVLFTVICNKARCIL